MRSTNRPGLAAHLLAAGLLGCAAPEQGTTLAEIARADPAAQVAVERDVCSCSCGRLVCWDFSCSGSGCSNADEYELIVRRGSHAARPDCFAASDDLGARLIVEDEEPLVTEAAVHGCDELAFRWRRPPAGLQARPHRIEIHDARETWSIDDPFASTSLAPIAPASVVTASTSTASTVRAGDAIAFALAPPAVSTEAHASLRSRVTHATIELPVVAMRGAELDVSMPADTPAGLYDFQLGAATRLPSSACHGPAVCGGLDAATSFVLRVE